MNKLEDDYQDKEYESKDFEDDEESEDADRLFNKLDDELLEMFSEARIITKRSSKQKKKKEKIVYLMGDNVKVNNRKGIILYGPYEIDNKQMYEIEIENEGVISAEEKHITKE